MHHRLSHFCIFSFLFVALRTNVQGCDAQKMNRIADAGITKIANRTVFNRFDLISRRILQR